MCDELFGLAFFRIFDIAFFAPGVLLFASLVWADLLPYALLESIQGEAEAVSVGGVFIFILGLALVYALGMALHGIQRLAKFAKSKVTGGQARDTGHWYQKLDPDRREDLETYFWYLRGTVANLAVAVPVSAIILVYQSKWEPIGLLPAGLLALVYTFLAWEYKESLRKAALAESHPVRVDLNLTSESQRAEVT